MSPEFRIGRTAGEDAVPAASRTRAPCRRELSGAASGDLFGSLSGELWEAGFSLVVYSCLSAHVQLLRSHWMEFPFLFYDGFFYNAFSVETSVMNES
jgi:hypothetical protein